MIDFRTAHGDADEGTWHRALAREVFDLDLDPGAEVRAERNVLSVAGDRVCFAQRLDCRTYFVENLDYGHDRPGGVFGGSDEEQLAYGRSMVERLGIAPEEIATEDVLREYGQAVELDPATGEVLQVTPSRELRSFIHLTRRVAGSAVWSSHLKLGLTAERTIGFLELHWPTIPDSVVRESQRLQRMVSSGWTPPELPSATVESIEAGVVHTPAVGYFLDVHAAVRVIYRSDDPSIGRKPMYHLDRHGSPVLLRSSAELVRRADSGRAVTFGGQLVLSRTGGLIRMVGGA